MLGRLREACGDDMDKLSRVIEIDEAYIGGKESNKHAHKRKGKHGTEDKRSFSACVSAAVARRALS